jgi:hypothetical protein
MGAGRAGLGEDFPNEPPPPKRFASTLVNPLVIPTITIINATQSFFMVPPNYRHAEKSAQPNNTCQHSTQTSLLGVYYHQTEYGFQQNQLVTARLPTRHMF